jgi:hypothetical protein
MYKLKSVTSLCFGIAMLSLIVSHPVGATIIFQTGNVQYTNVNIAAAVDASSILGDVGNTGLTMTFANMIGPDGSSQVSMHGQHGVAFVESAFDSQPSVTHTGFSSITLLAQAGYGFSAGDFKLDELAGGSNPGSVSFTALDQFGNSSMSTFAMNLNLNGQNPFNFFTLNGELATSIVITAPTTALLQDIKQVSVNEVQIPTTPPSPPVPEPSTLALLGLGLAGIGYSKCRKQA